jgi:hypothetical protein
MDYSRTGGDAGSSGFIAQHERAVRFNRANRAFSA